MLTTLKNWFFKDTGGIGTGSIYVSPTGKPGNKGSWKYPMDLQTALNSTSPGDTIYMGDGVYSQQNSFECVHCKTKDIEIKRLREIIQTLSGLVDEDEWLRQFLREKGYLT